MAWTRTEDGERITFEREDDTAVLTVRPTATDTWAVTLDLLEQAPDGPDYRRETVADRDTALATAREWREQ